jgi:hypothetical protein
MYISALGLRKSFLNQTIYICTKKLVVPTIFLKLRFFFKSGFLKSRFHCIGKQQWVNGIHNEHSLCVKCCGMVDSAKMAIYLYIVRPSVQKNAATAQIMMIQ